MIQLNKIDENWDQKGILTKNKNENNFNKVVH